MATKKETRGGQRGGGDEFEEFDVGAGDTDEFDLFDVAEEAASEPESLLEALSDLGAGDQDVQAVAQARDELEARLMIEPAEVAFAAAEEGAAGFGNLVGIGIGEKEVGGIPTGQLAVKVFVKEKLRTDQVSGEASVPPTMGGVPTDVDATGEIATQRFTGRFRPAPGGVSIGNCNVVHAGTLGCLVSRGRQLFILSNNHVMAAVNRGPIGVGISQPGRLDGGICLRDVIARLTQWIPIVFGGAANRVDCAIAQTSPLLVNRRILRPGGLRPTLVRPELNPVLGQRVQKSGRTTQYRRGAIDAVNVTVNVSYAPLGGIGRFVNQFRVRGLGAIFSDRGDSGSLVTTYPANSPVGLLFAGNAATNTTFCNPIRTVLAALGVAIVY